MNKKWYSDSKQGGNVSSARIQGSRNSKNSKKHLHKKSNTRKKDPFYEIRDEFRSFENKFKEISEKISSDQFKNDKEFESKIEKEFEEILENFPQLMKNISNFLNKRENQISKNEVNALLKNIEDLYGKNDGIFDLPKEISERTGSGDQKLNQNANKAQDLKGDQSVLAKLSKALDDYFVNSTKSFSNSSIASRCARIALVLTTLSQVISAIPTDSLNFNGTNGSLSNLNATTSSAMSNLSLLLNLNTTQIPRLNSTSNAFGYNNNTNGSDIDNVQTMYGNCYDPHPIHLFSHEFTWWSIGMVGLGASLTLLTQCCACYCKYYSQKREYTKSHEGFTPVQAKEMTALNGNVNQAVGDQDQSEAYIVNSRANIIPENVPQGYFQYLKGLAFYNPFGKTASSDRF